MIGTRTTGVNRKQKQNQRPKPQENVLNNVQPPVDNVFCRNQKGISVPQQQSRGCAATCSFCNPAIDLWGTEGAQGRRRPEAPGELCKRDRYVIWHMPDEPGED